MHGANMNIGIGISLKIVNMGHLICSIFFIRVNMVFISSFCITSVILTFVQSTDHLCFIQFTVFITYCLQKQNYH